MKLLLGFSLFLSTLLLLSEKSFSLTDYQIKKICQNKQREITCIKNLKKKRSNLQNGHLIEIPVIPYKR